MIGIACSAQETQPQAIVQKVIVAYASLKTYSAEGTIISDIDSGVGKMKIEASFSMKLKKPNSYLIVWEQKMAMIPFPQSGAVWNEGNQPYLYMGVAEEKAYSKMSNDGMALAGATGISGGAAFTIPSLFFSVFKEKPDNFASLIDPKLTGSEPVEDDDCYVITGSSKVSKLETFWISKKTYMIKKCSCSLEPPEGGLKMPKMTDQQLEEGIKAMGQEVTEESKEATRKMMSQAEDRIKMAKLKGLRTELHTKIDTSELKAGDFSFTLPAGTVLEESLFGKKPKK